MDIADGEKARSCFKVRERGREREREREESLIAGEVWWQVGNFWTFWGLRQWEASFYTHADEKVTLRYCLVYHCTSSTVGEHRGATKALTGISINQKLVNWKFDLWNLWIENQIIIVLKKIFNLFSVRLIKFLILFRNLLFKFLIFKSYLFIIIKSTFDI